MGDLAVLGLRIESQEVEAANRRLDSFTSSADGAQRATDLLGTGSDKAHSAIAQLMASIDRTTKEMLELQRAQRLATGAAADQTGATAALTKATADLNAQMAQASTSHLRFGSSFKTTQDGMGGAAAAAGNFGNAIEQADAHVAAYLASMASGDKTHKSAAKSQAEVTKGAKDLGAALGRMAGDAVTGRASLDGLATNGERAGRALWSMGGRAALLGGILTGVIVTVGLLAKAFRDGERDSNKFANAIAITGNYAGITTAQYETMVKAVQGGANSGFGTARQTLLGLVSTGKFTSETIQYLSQDIIKLARFTGQSTTQMSGYFAEMGDKVGDFAVKFNSSYHMLTLAQIEHIQLLESQGKTTEARLELAIAIHKRLGEIGPENLGYLERAWRGVGSAISWAWEQLKGFGRDSGIEAQIDRINGALAANEKKIGVSPAFTQRLLAERAALQATLDQNKAASDTARVQQEGVDAAERLRTTWAGMGDNVARARTEIAKYRADIDAVRQANPNSHNIPSAAQQAAAEAAIMKKYTPEATAAANRAASAARSAAAAAERRAESLARELEGMRQTARANHDLAAAYGVSDVEALKAAASAEAVGRAIRRQGEVSAFVAAQLELNASKLAASSAQQASDLRFAAEGQERMNAAVAAGTTTTQEATELLSLEAHLRPLIAAAAAVEGGAKADLLRQIEAVTAATKRMNAATREASIIQAQTNNRDRLTVLQLERDLVGANNIERARQLAMLEEEIRLRNQYGKDFINSSKGQGLINDAGNNAAFGEQTQRDVARYNLALVEQLDLLRQIDDQTRSAAQGMADSFGSAGRAVGDLAVSMTSYQSRLEEIRVAREQMSREGTLNSQREAMFARDAAQAQIQSYGDMMGAAKGFFREGSDGFKILQAAEQGYRIFQFAMALQSMALTGQETAFTVGQNLIRSASHGVVAVARALASLPFPLNLAAGAATVAALAAIGVKIAGKSGGGGAGTNAVEDSVSTAQGYAETADQARASAAQAVATQVKVQIELNDPMFKARVQQEAVGVAAPMVAAAAAGTKRDVMDTLKNQQVGNRRAMV
ncbi:phage tail length tape measure family protein [Brevundimonas sp.]|uniref:phage tail length tape measure family protein n=1 Tax=Brevundimonas sp. TaxID=1871086 RepID=UPI0025B905E5|nr:phage tail length tape measure family protein [Brevundimonas sp.]